MLFVKMNMENKTMLTFKFEEKYIMFPYPVFALETMKFLPGNEGFT